MVSVCAIMPTRGRPLFARQALASFLSQDWEDRQIVILDDNTDPSFEEEFFYPFLIYPLITYNRASSRNIAEKRNLCCAMAPNVDIFMHFDSDDWSAPGRMREQVERMQREEKAVSGYSSAWFYVEQDKEWRLWTSEHAAPYVLGTSLAYTRQWWERFPFETEIGAYGVGEDNHMNGQARDENQLSSANGLNQIVARVHPANTSYKDPSGWPLMPRPPIAHFWDSQRAK